MTTRYARYLDLIDQASRMDIGYDQVQRFSYLDLKNGRLIDHSECDCSALSLGLAKLAGYPIDMTPPVWTGTAREKTAEIGWRVTNVTGWTAAQIQRIAQTPGQMLVNETHHIVSQTRHVGSWLSANMDERGRATGGRAGDQTGNEVSLRPLWNYSHGGWNFLLTPNDATGGSPQAAGAGVPQEFGKYLSEADRKLLQARIGTVADGIVGPNTIKALEIRAGYDPDGTLDTPSNTIEKAQKFLNRFVGAGWCHYAKLDEDGITGPKTEAAISNYLNAGHGAFTGLAGITL